MPLTKGRLGTIKERVILFFSECDLNIERWMTVELSLHHIAGQTGEKIRAIITNIGIMAL